MVSDTEIPRACASAAVMDLHGREAAAVLEYVLLFAMRRDQDAPHDLLAELMAARDRDVRVWTIGPLMAAMRSWEVLG